MRDAMPPGPELDALVAAKVMGERLDREHEPGESYSDCMCYVCGQHHEWGQGDFESPCVRPYSTDLTTCAAAAEEARKAGKIQYWEIRSLWPGKLRHGSPHAEVIRGDRSFGTYPALEDDIEPESPAHALALALLKAVGA